MIVACLTGGIATGKSEFSRLLADGGEGVAFFDCDRCVHELLTLPEMVRQIVTEFGPEAGGAEGGIDRRGLRGIVFADSQKRRRLEEILHPEVRRLCQEARERAAADPAVRLFLAEVPLLYESGFDVSRDYEIVVAASPATQRARLRDRRGIDGELADRILAAQRPILEKVQRAGIVIWNGGSLECLKRQAQLMMKRLLPPVQ